MEKQEKKPEQTRIERLQSFYNALLDAARNGYKSSKGIKAVERVADTIRTQMRTRADGRKKTLSLNTIKTYYTDLRKMVVDNRAEFEKVATGKDYFARVLDTLKLSDSEESELIKDRTAYRAKVNDRLISADMVTDALEASGGNMTPLYDFSGLLEHAKSLITATESETINYYKIAAGLMLLTGRRATEIFKTGSFELVEHEPQKVLFKGQLKKRKTNAKGDISELNDENKGYVIPVLADAKTIIKALNLMRETANEKRQKTGAKLFADMPIESINTSTASNLNIHSRQEFAEWLGADMSAHSLRKAYLSIAFHQYKTNPQDTITGTPNTKKTSLQTFARNVLGHTGGVGNEGRENDLTTNTYFVYKIITQTSKPEPQPEPQPQVKPETPTNLLNLSVKDRLIWVVDNILLTAEQPAYITQYTLKKAYFEQFNSNPDHLAMCAILKGEQKNKAGELVKLPTAVLNASKRIQAHNKKLDKR